MPDDTDCLRGLATIQSCFLTKRSLMPVVPRDCSVNFVERVHRLQPILSNLSSAAAGMKSIFWGVPSRSLVLSLSRAYNSPSRGAVGSSCFKGDETEARGGTWFPDPGRPGRFSSLQDSGLWALRKRMPPLKGNMTNVL